MFYTAGCMQVNSFVWMTDVHANSNTFIVRWIRKPRALRKEEVKKNNKNRFIQFVVVHALYALVCLFSSYLSMHTHMYAMATERLTYYEIRIFMYDEKWMGYDKCFIAYVVDM